MIIESSSCRIKCYAESSTRKLVIFVNKCYLLSCNDSAYFRPTEVELLIGDATKARTKLGWIPEYNLAALVKDMMRSDLKLMHKDSYLKEGGYNILNYFE